MSKAYINVLINDNKIRTYGGNKSDVKYMKLQYDKMTFKQFQKIHPYTIITEKDFKTLKVDYFVKNR